MIRLSLGAQRVLGWLAFAIALLLASCSLLVLFSAPTSWLWIVSILVTEWPHWAALIYLLLAALCFRFGKLGKVAAALAIASTLLCLLPIVRAAQIARSLPERCTSAFGPASSGNAEPFSITTLFRGPSTADVRLGEHIYARDGKRSLKLDLYTPNETQAPLPLIVLVPGGSWSGGSRKQLPEINRYLAQQQFAVAAINYRHAPQSPFPAAVEDIFRAIEFLRTNAAELQLDTSRIVLIGRSAGGQLALSAAYAQREPAVRGVIAFYPPTDLVFGYERPSRRWVLDSKKALEAYLGGVPNEQAEKYAAASPVHFVNGQTPPTLLIHGGLDPMVWPEHSRRLAERLQAAGRPHLYLHLPHATHGCDANLSGPSGQLSLYAIDHFLATVLAVPSGQAP
ncbi:alpha/beta hydrolase [soil metagenome]